MRYLFAEWIELKKKFKNKYIFLFLDYDGTLTPIVEKPEQAVLSEEIRKLLQRLTKIPKTKLAMVSGRELKDIKNKVGLKNIIYVGNHGLEWEGPKIKFECPVSVRYRAFLKEIKNDLTQKLSSVKGVILEDKGLSLSLHYRLVDKKISSLVKTIFHEAVIPYLVNEKIKIRMGKKVFEVRPPLRWDKGKTVLWLLARQKFVLGKKPLIPIYLGDDVSDEDAFKAIRNKGLTVFVGKPKESYAQYYLKNTREVTKFLKQILEL